MMESDKLCICTPEVSNLHIHRQIWGWKTTFLKKIWDSQGLCLWFPKDMICVFGEWENKIRNGFTSFTRKIFHFQLGRPWKTNISSADIGKLPCILCLSAALLQKLLAKYSPSATLIQPVLPTQSGWPYNFEPKEPMNHLVPLILNIATISCSSAKNFLRPDGNLPCLGNSPVVGAIYICIYICIYMYIYIYVCVIDICVEMTYVHWLWDNMWIPHDRLDSRRDFRDFFRWQMMDIERRNITIPLKMFGMMAPFLPSGYVKIANWKMAIESSLMTTR